MDILLYTALLGIVLFVFFRFASSTKEIDPMTETNDTNKPIVEGKFTPKTLYKFNGHDDEKIYIAVKGNVYDVTAGRAFYGPSGPYNNFAGHDASRGLAKNSFDIECVTPYDQPIDKLADLSQEDHDALNGWEEHFQKKYAVVGVLEENDS